MEKLVLIDGNSLFNRAFYSTPLSFTNSDGIPTNAIYGFTTMLFKAIIDIKPTRLAVAFDLRAPTFRHKMYSDYKGNRKGMPEELAVQVPLIKSMLAAMGIKYYELEGYEADDILGTIAKKIPEETHIVTGDYDYLQLIDDSTTIYITKKGLSNLECNNKSTLFEDKGLVPSQIIDMKSLMGDSSDNIPGVKGVGEKTALNLLNKYNTLDGVYENIDEIKGKLKEKLVNDKEKAYLSYELATICTEVPIDFNLDDCILKIPFGKNVIDIFKKFSFNSLLKRTEFFEGGESLKEAKNAKFECKIVNIKSISELQDVINKNKNAKEVAIDVNSPAFAFDKKTSYTIEIAENLLTEGIAYDDFIKEMKPVFEGDMPIIIYDKKSLRYLLFEYNVTVNNARYDLMLMNYCCNFKSSLNSLMALINYYEFENKAIGSSMIALKECFNDILKQENIEKLYFDIELPLADVLYDMERTGFRLDIEENANLKKQYETELDGLSKKIYELAGENFNINSPKQLGVILFDRLGLKASKKTKSGYSTDAKVLEKLLDKHEIIKYILRYRQINKLLSTYIDGLASQVEGDNHKIHTIFNQALTVTGRLSSKSPNLQNIPTRTPEGQVMRKLFLPSDDNHIIISADYSQIELRLLAHFSKDEILTDAYKNKRDIHATTASEVFDVPLNKVTKEQRSKAKAVNFGIIYGISAFGLSKQINETVSKAKKYMNDYFETYPKVKSYMESNVEKCKKDGYVETIIGRRRYIPEIHSKNFNQRSFAERAAMNMPLQGSSADIIKIAMINVYKKMNEEGLKSKLILQIHDELLIDTVIDERDVVSKILKNEMENAVKLNVPLPVNIASGVNWYEAK